jgi:hypothetical protein
VAFLLPILVYDRSWIRSRKGVSSLYIDCILRWPLGGPPGDLNDGAIGLGYRFSKVFVPSRREALLTAPEPSSEQDGIRRVHRTSSRASQAHQNIRAESADAAESVLGIVQFPLLLIL